MVTRLEPRSPKGMRDLLPDAMIRRRYVMDRVREVFEEFGFGPLETPALELEETLLGKYGADAEKLIYTAQHPHGKERLALRYDLSVPLARVIAMHQDLPKPFKRYQIAPVWRAERPQKGRYREFYQCDVDTVGAPGMLADAEILQVIHEVLRRLGFTAFTIKLNNRKILNGIGKFAGVPADLLPGLYRAIDKLERIGLAGVEKELQDNRIPAPAIRRLMALLQVSGDGRQVLEGLRERLVPYREAVEGIEELEEILRHLEAMAVPLDPVRVEFSMVRGLEYYTGPIYETVVDRPRIGSLTGGGRYDRLIGMFTGRDLPATGTTIGIERLIDVMEELAMLPARMGRSVAHVLVTVFDRGLLAESLRLAGQLRQDGVRTEVFLEPRPLSDQMRYANKTGIPVAVFLGPEEVRAGRVKLRHLGTGEERTVETDQAVGVVRGWVEARG